MWSKTKLRRLELPHRLAMAPMTRSRAQEDGTLGELASLYYTQRASLGLLISEGTQPSADGQGYLWSPGIYTEKHIEGWKKVTDAVHEADGFMYIQLMHVGRVSHPDNTPHHRQALAPSAIAPGVPMFTTKGPQDVPVPREMTEEDIQTTIADFRKAAAAVVDEIYADRTGFRISLGNLGYVGINEGENGLDVYRHLIPELAKLNLAYLHVMHLGNDAFLKEVREAWPNSLLVNRSGRPLEKIDVDIENNLADVAPIGTWAIANPDFVERLKKGYPYE